LEPILEVKNLQTTFKLRHSKVHAVNGISFALRKGEMLGVVGESGSGKSVSMLSIIDLLPPAARVEAGEVLLGERNLRRLSRKQLQKVRGNKIGMIFQDPMTSLNPVLKIGPQMAEALMYHRKVDKAGAYDRCEELLRLVGISNPRERLNEYPHQLSGGMRQRVMIAMALTCDPEILIADEPTTALDVTIQAQIVELIKSIRDRLGMSIILITHDLGLIAGMVDRVIVMYAGHVVEEASVDDIYADPRHPYTKGLLESVPSVRGAVAERLSSISGSPPDLTSLPVGCPFMPRCRFAVARCAAENPPLTQVDGAEEQRPHGAACWVDVRDGSER
jgi:oligopeptide/dipeptide ABC transporter ATP-binding protein